VSLEDASDWKGTCERSWKEYDDPESGSVTRKVPIAMVANGLVTQLTMTPFLSLGSNGSGDDWHPDSECGVYLSLDPENEHACPKYVEESYTETETHVVGKDLNGNPITREVEVTKTRPKQAEDALGNKLSNPDGSPIYEQAKDEGGYPLYNRPKHQVHNFETGDDGGDTTIDAEYNRTNELVAVRVPKNGGAELMWRHVKFSQEAPCPPVIEVSEPVRYGNVIKFTISIYEGAKGNGNGSSSGSCGKGALISATDVEIPIIDPNLALQEKCVITGVNVSSTGITFTREKVLCSVGAGACAPITLEGEACEET
jgi:hypothetical protein